VQDIFPRGTVYKNLSKKPVLRIRIRMDPHDFDPLDPHPESAFQMRIPDADADPG
jgi:hypothetical protein